MLILELMYRERPTTTMMAETQDITPWTRSKKV